MVQATPPLSLLSSSHPFFAPRIRTARMADEPTDVSLLPEFARPRSRDQVGQDLAGETRKKACPCGGRLHSANYLRKPRGTPVQLPEQECLRFSFCCDRVGCRKRVTPPSVRFMGRKVYFGAIIILISGRGPHHAASANFPHASAPTKAQSPAGRPSGATFPTITLLEGCPRRFHYLRRDCRPALPAGRHLPPRSSAV